MAQDLHNLLNAARDDAPPPRLSVDDITSAGRQLVRRRRRLTMLSSVAGGAVAAVAAVTAALVLSGPAPLTPALDPSRGPLPASPVPTEFVEAPAFTTTYEGYEAGRYTVTSPDLVTIAYQQSSINTSLNVSADSADPSAAATVERLQLPGLTAGGALVVYRAGAFNEREFAGSEEIDLKKGTGLLYYAGGVSAPSTPASDLAKYQKMRGGIPALAWQYSADAWAAIYWSAWETTPDRDDLVAIADGLRPASPKAFPIGVMPKIVPKGYTLVSASFGQDLPAEQRAVSAARLSVKPPQLPLTRPIDFEDWPVLTFSLGRDDPPAKVTKKPQCGSDRQSCVLILDSDATYVRVDPPDAKQVVTGEAGELLLSTAAGDPDDRAGWPPATKVFTTD